MRKKVLVLLCLTAIVINADAQKKTKTNPLNNAAISYLDNTFAEYDKLQKQIWNTPELGFLE